MIYIDFPGGAHGHFLEFIIFKYVLRVPAYKNFLPFTNIGTSHNKIKGNYEVKADHFTEYKRIINLKKNDLLIKIPVILNDTYLKFIFWGNTTLRCGDGTFEPNNFNINTIEKLQNPKFSNLKNTIINDHGYSLTYSKQYLRNLFYSQIREENLMFDEYKNFNDLCLPNNSNQINFAFNNFYNFENFITTLNEIAKFLNTQEINPAELESDYSLFLSKHQVYQMKENVRIFFEAILNDKIYFTPQLNLIEEAFLNVLITENFNIHSNISTFDENYSYNAVAISNEIKQVMKDRNAEFSLDVPINQQLNKIVLEF